MGLAEGVLHTPSPRAETVASSVQPLPPDSVRRTLTMVSEEHDRQYDGPSPASVITATVPEASPVDIMEPETPVPEKTSPTQVPLVQQPRPAGLAGNPPAATQETVAPTQEPPPLDLDPPVPTLKPLNPETSTGQDSKLDAPPEVPDAGVGGASGTAEVSPVPACPAPPSPKNSQNSSSGSKAQQSSSPKVSVGAKARVVNQRAALKKGKQDQYSDGSYWK